MEPNNHALPPLKTKHERSERLVEQTIQVFRGGYMLSFALIAIGIVVALIRRIPLASELGPPAEIIRDLMDVDPNGFIGLGIGAMIITPIIMTIEVTVNFFRAGDSRFGIISGIVAGILMVTMALAFL
jgi:uncharacterized membrane protein